MEDITNRFGFKGYVDSRIGGRQENQDSYGYADTPLGLLVVVCDGMGGGPAGKTASELAVNTIVGIVKSCKPQDNPEHILQKAVESANSALLGAVSANPSLQGMGTTCVALLVNRKNAYIAHVGDSRCYVLRDGKTAFRTADHSYVAEMVRKGELTEEQARLSNNSNVITRAVGIRPTIEADIDKVSIKSGDRFALMTDGIWGALPEVHLVSSLFSDEELPFVVSELADRVDAMGHNNGGKHDNMTLAVVDFPANDKRNATKPADTENYGDGYSLTEDTPKSQKSRLLRLLTVLLVFSLGVNAYFGVSSLLKKGKTEPQSSSSIKRNPQIVMDNLNKEIDELKRNNIQLKDSLANKGKVVITQGKNGEEQENTLKSTTEEPTQQGEGFHFDDKKKFLLKAVEYLSRLDTLGTDGVQKNKNRDALLKKLQNKRMQMRNNICSNLRQAANICIDADKSKVLELHNRIEKSIKITRADSQGRPTREAKDEIKTYIEQIKTFSVK